jgi:hypothetical protein
MDIELPDIDKMMNLIDEIYNNSVEKGRLEILIKVKESEVTRVAQTDEKYFQNGKPPSQTFVDNAYKYTGFDGDILELRLKLVEAESSLYKSRNELDLDKILIDIWRTQAANERVG